MTNHALLNLNDPLATIARELHRDPHLKSEHTRRGYLTDLKIFNEWRAGRPVTKLLVEEFAAQLQSTEHSPNSINRSLAAVRWWARRMGDLAAEDPTLGREHQELIITQSARVVAIEDVDGTREPKGRHVALGELTALMHVCAVDASPRGVRDAALIALGWSTGARRAEIAGLKLDDLKFTAEREADLVIHGKGDKVRTVYIYNGAADALRDWLPLRGDDPGPLFYAIRKNDKIVCGHGLGDEALALILEKRQREALVDELTWHDFRRTFAGNLLDSGVDLATVQKLMGHSSPTTTSNYDRRDEQAKRRAVQTLNVPYTRRLA